MIFRKLLLFMFLSLSLCIYAGGGGSVRVNRYTELGDKYYKSLYSINKKGKVNSSVTIDICIYDI